MVRKRSGPRVMSPLSQLRPEVPRALDGVVERCLRRDPADRYAHIGEFARALADVFPHTYAAHVDKISRILEIVRESRRPPQWDTTREDSAEDGLPASGVRACAVEIGPAYEPTAPLLPHLKSSAR